MFRNLSDFNPPNSPFRSRRQAQSRPDFTFQQYDRFDCPFPGFNQLNGGLELSVHQARGPSNNRFATLASPATNPMRDRAHHISGHPRRVRNSRGTKEAKKRRDARRNRRKLVTQMLDDELSRHIDRALADTSVRRLPALVAPTDLSKPSVTFVWPSWEQTPPTPPQLPVLDFGSFDLKHFPDSPWIRSTVSPTPPSVLSKVPKWCPYIPSLMRNGGWTGDVPRCTDLSSLSERNTGPEQDALQSWRPLKPVQPKKESRFFPALTTSVSSPIVKLPPTRCKLHPSDHGLQDPQSTAWRDKSPRGAPHCISRYSVGTSGDEGHSLSGQMEDACQQVRTPFMNHGVTPFGNAVNLWQILSEDRVSLTNQANSDPQVVDQTTSSWDESEDCGGVSLTSSNHQTRKRDHAEIPYVHLNSLTGIANESGQGQASADQQDLMLSAMYLADFFATPRANTPTPQPIPSALSYTPSSPSLHTSGGQAYRPLPSRHVSTEATSSAEEMKRSTEHFTSEQDLFKPEQVPLPKSRPQTPIDLATFLSMGHVENCWCRDCNEAPEMIHYKEFDENDDEWVDWSSMVEDVATAPPLPLTATVSEVEDEDRCGRAEPASSAYPEQHVPDHEQEYAAQHPLDHQFLGCLDDGLAFAQDDDFYWI